MLQDNLCSLRRTEPVDMLFPVLPEPEPLKPAHTPWAWRSGDEVNKEFFGQAPPSIFPSLR